jgi:periplasmic protein TonB
MKILTLTDRLWGLGMTTAVYGAVVPALLMLGAGVGKAPAHPGALKTFDVALPQPEPQPDKLAARRPAAPVRERQLPPEPARSPLPPPASASSVTMPSPSPVFPEPAAITAPPRITPPVPAELTPTKPAGSMILNGYASRLWSHIASRRPRGMRLAGTTTVTFSLSRAGELRNVSITGKSGNPMLDSLALRTIRGAAPFPAPPEALDEEQLTFTIPFSFR